MVLQHLISLDNSFAIIYLYGVQDYGRGYNHSLKLLPNFLIIGTTSRRFNSFPPIKLSQFHIFPPRNFQPQAYLSNSITFLSIQGASQTWKNISRTQRIERDKKIALQIVSVLTARGATWVFLFQMVGNPVRTMIHH